MLRSRIPVLLAGFRHWGRRVGKRPWVDQAVGQAWAVKGLVKQAGERVAWWWFILQGEVSAASRGDKDGVTLGQLEKEWAAVPHCPVRYVFVIGWRGWDRRRVIID